MNASRAHNQILQAGMIAVIRDVQAFAEEHGEHVPADKLQAFLYGQLILAGGAEVS